ncbi:MAG: hypothetical protein QM750_23135 [Rubrivivax sp.]
MNTPIYVDTARPFREARGRYLVELQQVREQIAQRNADIAAPPPDVGLSALDIERAKLLDSMRGTNDAPALVAAEAAAKVGLAQVRRAAAEAKEALPGLLARAELLEDLANESKRLELVALSAAAGKAWPAARAAYRRAAEDLVDQLAQLMATMAVLGAEHRLKMNREVGHDSMTPFEIPKAALTLPSLETIGHDLGGYLSGTPDHVHIANELRDRANAQLQALIGEN